MNKLTDTLAKKAKIPYYKKTAYVLFAFALLVFIMTYFVLMIVLYRTQVQETNNLKSSLTSQYCSSVDLSLTSTIDWMVSCILFAKCFSAAILLWPHFC